jgi:amidase
MTARDDSGAFVPGPRCMVEATASGELDGLTFAVKDLIDVAGWVTGAGNPDWAAGRPPAARHGSAVERLLGAGASVAGKTITDELAFSLEGENWHYGIPRNPRCPECLPGGSSSGSAVAVAAGLVDFALGTDTGGSVRVPAAFCGVFGMRPTHGRIALDGVVPFAPDYDTVGWFTRSAGMLEKVGRVLLDMPVAADDGTAPRLVLLDDVFRLSEPAVASHLRLAAAALGQAGSLEVFDGRAADWRQCYQVLQGIQVRQSLGRWLAQRKPRFGPAIAARFAGLDAIDDEQVRRAAALRATIRERLDRLLQPGVVLVLPTAPTTPLRRDASSEQRDAFYEAALAINAISAHAGLPQLAIPCGTVAGKPVSLSFIAARGADALLLRNAQRWAGAVDSVGAWVPNGRFVIAGAAAGPLAGLTFAAKDVFDVAGHATGAGNPTWLATHPVPLASSPIIDSLLAAGATLLGKTLTDELAYSIHGDNVHYGTPANAAAPGRVPGGSSSGSAAAVAAGLCDFALGTDTGGSTRVPASYCGLWGLRTSHDLLPRSCMVPLNPSFDTPTWLARDGATFQRVAEALLPYRPAPPFRRVLMLQDVLAQADDVFHAKAEQVFAALGRRLHATRTEVAAGEALESWRLAYVTISAQEAWQQHGDWITEHRPTFGAAVARRWETARHTGDAAAAAARAHQGAIRAAVRSLLDGDGVAVLPSAASVAPLLSASDDDIDQLRSRTFRMTCVAGLAGLPQVSMPFVSPDGLPIGISLLGPAGSDRALVALAVALAAEMNH